MMIKMAKLAITLTVLVGLLYSVACSCVFPTNLQGDWESPSLGNITITSTQMTGYEVDTYTNLTFDCEIKSGSKYVLRSDNFTVLAGNKVYALLCLKIKQQTQNKFTYFVLTSEISDLNNTRVVLMDSTVATVTIDDACDNLTVQDTPQNTKLLVRYGYASSEAIQCPDAILGQYTYYNGTSCNDSFWDVCTDLTTMTFSYDLCVTQIGFSASGEINCLQTIEDGTQQIIYVYNTDSTVDSEVNGTYQYSCMVVDLAGDGYVYVTQYPEDCHVNQTAYSVDAPGFAMQLSPNITCIPVDTTTTTTTTEATTQAQVSQAGLIAGLTVLFLVLLAAGVVVLVYCIWKKKKVSPTADASIKTIQNSGKITKEPIMLEEADGRETITPSAMSTHIQSRSGSHGKLKQVLGAEYTMTGETKLRGEATTNQIDEENTDTDDAKQNIHAEGNELHESEVTPRKLPPITEKPISPTDTRLDQPLPPIR